MNKKESIKIFFALVGTGYLISIIVGLISIVGTTSEAKTYDWWSVINFVVLVYACHISIEWIKDLFNDQLL